MRSWSRRRKVVVALVAVAAAWGVAAAWLLLDARSAARAGASELRAVRAGSTLASLVEVDTADRLDAAGGHFDDASEALDSPLLLPLRILPVASRHMDAADRLVEASGQGVDAAVEALDRLRALTERPRTAGPDRVATVRDLQGLAERASADLSDIDPGSPDALVGQLGDAVAELTEQRDSAVSASDRLAEVAGALADMLEGPEPYLLLGANNAEMRNGSGMFLSAATLGFDAGRLSLGEVRPTAELVLPEGTVAVSGDLATNWPWLDPGRDLRNLGLTADFPQSAALAAANWESVPGGTRVAGVMVLDVDAIRELIGVVGPVTVEGYTYTYDTVRGELMRQQYARFDGDQAGRRDQLGEVAKAIFERIEAGDWAFEDLATALVDMVGGRHLMIWSADADAQEAWSSVGADGHLEEDSLSVALVNRAGNKLDSWIDTEANLVSKPAGGTSTEITLTYRITSRAPGSGPAYQVGPNVEGLAAGDHRALVVVNLPQGSTEVAMEGARLFLDARDGPTGVVAGEVTIGKGKSVTVTVTARLAEGVGSLSLEPSARIPHTVWTVDGETFERERRRTVTLGGD